jgi:hypothetical protein
LINVIPFDCDRHCDRLRAGFHVETGKEDHSTGSEPEGPATAMGYQRRMIRSAPRIVSQTAANSIASMMTAASSAIESRSPSSSR